MARNFSKDKLSEVSFSSKIYELLSYRRDAKGASEYKLRLFDLQTECYQVLERLLVILGREAEALVVSGHIWSHLASQCLSDIVTITLCQNHPK